MKEAWRIHPIFTDYEISDQGRVKRITSKRGAVIGRILKPGRTWQGYRVVVVSGIQKRIYVLVLEAFLGPRPSGGEARHLNDVKDDDRLCNLAWGTHAENYADRIVNGGGNHGSRHGLAKLSEETVKEIRRTYVPRVITQKKLAERFGVSRRCIGFALNGQRWGHV